MTPRRITTVFVENTDSTGPFGSKGVAESAGLSTAPAIINAIYDATGVRIKRLPAREHFIRAEKAGD
jgi:CO/xanthine dehydrogenase Mo-binding subunit